jgi:hypothetical protein
MECPAGIYLGGQLLHAEVRWQSGSLTANSVVYLNHAGKKGRIALKIYIVLEYCNHHYFRS